MSRRVAAVRGGHHHLAWEDQPLVRSTARPRTHAARLILMAFVAGLFVGLLI